MDHRNHSPEVVVAEQLALALKSWSEESRTWEVVWVQVPEASRKAAIVECARLVAQAIRATERDDGEDNEQSERGGDSES
jgi:hypothetical protein